MMGAYWTKLSPTKETHKGPELTTKPQMHVLIAGAGIVGLTIAQGCRENGIPYTIFERDTAGSRAQGCALTLHWSLRSLERTIGPKLGALLPTAVVNPSLKTDDGNFLFLNAKTAEPRYRIPPSKRRLRLHRQRLRDVLATGLDIKEGKRLATVETLPDGTVKAYFADGTSATGTILIGADGNTSVVRNFLLPDNYKLNTLHVHLIGVVRHFTPGQAEQVRALDPLLFQALHPDTGSYLWYRIQECFNEPDGRKSFDALVIISWIIIDEVEDAIPATHRERIALMKRRAQGFAEPLASIVNNIPDELDHTTPLRLADFPCLSWDEQNGSVTLAGDSAHAMTMFRGEGANYGILDAALLVDQLKKIHEGTMPQKEAIREDEAEMRLRTHEGVLKSRQAAGITKQSGVQPGLEEVGF